MGIQSCFLPNEQYYHGFYYMFSVLDFNWINNCAFKRLEHCYAYCLKISEQVSVKGKHYKKHRVQNSYLSIKEYFLWICQHRSLFRIWFTFTECICLEYFFMKWFVSQSIPKDEKTSNDIKKRLNMQPRAVSSICIIISECPFLCTCKCPNAYYSLITHQIWTSSIRNIYT